MHSSDSLMVGLHAHDGSTICIGKAYERSELHIVRKAHCEHNVSVLILRLLKGGECHVTYSPLRNGTLDETTPKAIAPCSQLYRLLEIVLLA